MTTTNLFLRNVTCIDHAFVTQDGQIRGGSLHPNISVRGEVEAQEQVVVDFSKVKKQIKEFIDDPERGFDHKLWLVEGFSEYQKLVDSDGVIGIKTPQVEAILPSNAVRIVSAPEEVGKHYIDMVEYAMATGLSEHLSKVNGVELKVELTLNEQPFASNPRLFTYWHGLKNSSSWGCQNIAHGHTSFVECYNEDGIRVGEMERIISGYLDDACLVFTENLDSEGNIAYNTPRGDFYAKVKSKKIIMQQETTVENILEHVSDIFHATLEVYKVRSIFISEGLQKGAWKEILSYPQYT